MADKKIIINNVDVSRCECHNPNIKMDCLLYPLQSDACKNNPNCHYKLYKRKEQECETLASQLDFEVQKKECLEQECEELKIERDSWKYQWDKRYEICECLSDQLDQLNKELEQEKALKETYLACYKAKHGDIEGKLFKLKAENCELKGKVKLYEEILERSAQGFETGFQASMFAEMVNSVANSIKDEKLFKLKQTLTEIKEIVTLDKTSFKYAGSTISICDDILIKISEVEK